MATEGSLALTIIAGLVVLAAVGVSLFYGYRAWYLPNKPLAAGDLVQVRFRACPAVLTRAAFGASGGESHYDPSYATVSLRFCDMPDLAHLQGSRSTWIVDAGFNWRASESVCSQLAAALDGEAMTCSADSDCHRTISCDPTATVACGCSPDECTRMGGVQFLDCPCGAPCVADAKGNHYCSLSVHPTFTCAKDTGRCVVSTASCPPPPACNVHGMLQSVTDPVTGMASQSNMCVVNGASVASVSGGQTYYDPKNPCTGCFAGQTCKVTASDGSGVCTGPAQVYAAVKVDFIAEGYVATVDAARGALVQWERIQCQNPYALTDASFTGGVRCPIYFQGCLAWSSLSDASMRAALFGSPQADPTGAPEFADLGLKPADMWPLRSAIGDAAKFGPKYMATGANGAGTFSVRAISAYTIPKSGLDISGSC